MKEEAVFEILRDSAGSAAATPSRLAASLSVTRSVILAVLSQAEAHGLVCRSGKTWPCGLADEEDSWVLTTRCQAARS